MPDPTPTAPHDSNHHQTQRPSSSTSAALAIDGSEEDERLSKSEFLTRKEVLKRRVRRVRQLSKVYRDHYWALMEELKLRYREYYWEYGKSPFQEHDENNNSSNNNNGNANVKGENGEANFQESAEISRDSANGRANRCGVHGCKSKAMALTKFCQMHILSDAKQKLYKPCNYAIKRFTFYSLIYIFLNSIKCACFIGFFFCLLCGID